MNFIDIRSYSDYKLDHIDNAKWIDKNNLLLNPYNYLNKNELYYIYCNTGVNSSIVVNKLNNMGYKTKNVDGGFQKYKILKRRGF